MTSVQLKNTSLLKETTFAMPKPSVLVYIDSLEPLTRKQAIAAAVKHLGSKARGLGCRDAGAHDYCIHTETAHKWSITLEV